MNKSSTPQTNAIYYTIYQVTNVVNGKVYVGKHKTVDPNDRYLGSGKLLKRAVEKYGSESFVKQLLFVFSTEHEMNEKEKELVTREFCLRDNSYNLCEGGYGGWSYINRVGINNSGKDHREIAERVSAKNRGRRNPKTSETLKKRHEDGLVRYDTRTGQTLSEEHRNAISTASKARTGERNGSFGTCWMTRDGENLKVNLSDEPLFKAQGYSRGKAKLHPRPVVRCQRCDSDFEIPLRGRHNRKFCSRACSDASKIILDGLTPKQRNTLSKRKERERKKNISE